MRGRMSVGVRRRRAGLVALVVLLAVVLVPTPASAGAAGGPWVWPLAGEHAVSRPFDPPSTRFGPGHRGADLPGPAGSAVRAAGAGRVSYAGLLAGRGVVVVVHGALRTTYEPVTATVRVGQVVAAGAAIGRLNLGHAGCPGACLHWGLLRGAVYLDPVQLVTRGPSRLLPVEPNRVGPPAASRVRGSAVRAPAASPAAEPRPASEPQLGLRAAELGWGLTALLALVAGLALLLRPRRPPAGPATPSYAMTVPHAAGLVDLATERDRRRTSVA